MVGRSAGPAQTSVRIVFNGLPRAQASIHAAVVAQVKRSTYAVEAISKSLAPVRTGTLRRSIHSVFEDGGRTGICGPSVDYAAFVELGTRHMAARPYMRPAARIVLPRFADELAAILRGRL